MKINNGDVVIFIGWTEEQVRWGNNDYPYSLVVGKEYIVRNVESHSMHTKLELYGENGKFNSVHFNIK